MQVNWGCYCLSLEHSSTAEKNQLELGVGWELSREQHHSETIPRTWFALMTPQARNTFNWDLLKLRCKLWSCPVSRCRILSVGLFLYWEGTNDRIKAILEDTWKSKPQILVCYWECKAQKVCPLSPLQKLPRIDNKKY